MALTLVITDAGRAALVNAANDGTAAVRIASVGVSATAITASRTTAALPGEIKRIATISGGAMAADVIHLTVRDESNAVYTVRSVALYLANGVLFASYGQATPILEKSAAALMLLALDVTLVDVAATSVTFGDSNFLNPPATTERLGVVELATDAEAVVATDRQRAVTPAHLAPMIRRGAGVRPLEYENATGSMLIRGDSGGWDMGYKFLGSGGAYFGGFGAVGSGNELAYLWAGPSYGALNALRVYPDRVTWGTSVLWHAGNDGAGSGLDADLLDGQQGSWYADVAARLGFTPVQQGGGPGQSNSKVRIGWDGGSRLKGSVDGIDLGNFVFDAQLGQVWRPSNDGAGSGLDADLLDGLHASDFIQRANGSRPIDYDSYGGGLSMRGDAAGWELSTRYLGSGGGYLGGFGALGNGNTLTYFYMGASYSAANALRVYPDRVTWGTSLVWHAGNDGAGSGLDADLLDGLHASDFIQRANGNRPIDYDSYGGGLSMRGDAAGWELSTRYLGSGGGYLGGFGALGSGNTLSYFYMGASYSATNALRVYPDRVTWGTSLVWHAGNDGAGSGLDADLLDGQQGSWYADIVARLGYTPANRVGDTFTGDVSLAGTVALRSGAFPNSYLQLNDGIQGIRMMTEGGIVFGASTGRFLLSPTAVSFNNAVVWHAGNDGAGSGLDADLLDGWERDSVRDWNNLLNRPGAFPPTAHTHTAADLAPAFATHNFAVDGYQVLPGGLILQWVSGAQDSTGTEGAQGITYPIAFPNGALRAFVSTQIPFGSDRADSLYQLVGTPGQASAVVQRQRIDTTRDGSPTTPHLFVIGY